MKQAGIVKRAGVVFALACALAAMMFVLAACGSSSSSSSAVSGASVSAASSASASASAASSAAATEEATVTKEASLEEINIGEGKEISEEEAEEASLADVADEADAEDKGTATSQGKTSYKMEADYLDKYGNATVLAFTELNGWEFNSMIRDHGYIILDSYAWTRGNTGSLAFLDQTGSVVGPYTMKKLDKAGVGKKPAFMMSMVGDYKSAKACLDGMAPMVHDKAATNKTDDFAVGVVYGPSMKRVAVMVEKNKQGGFNVYAFSDEYLATGAVAKKVGGNFTDINGFWTFFTGAK